VPKKKFRKSVHRHRVLRLLREAWRLNKHPLYEAMPAELQLHVFIIFTDTGLPEFATVQEMVQKGIARFCNDFKAVDA
jgi:ribonuclease P protein component